MVSVPRAELLVATLMVATLAGPALASPAAAGLPLEEGLAGLVKSDRSPLSAARVWAYKVSDLSLTRATTGADGGFLFRRLPVGVYKVIAHKTGFVPAIVLLTRATQNATDFLEFELMPQKAIQPHAGDDFWSVRRKIPGDVLREIQLAELEESELAEEGRGAQVQSRFVTGYDREGSSQLQRTDLEVGVRSQIGRALLRVDGTLQELRSDTDQHDVAVRGKTTSLTVAIETEGGGALRLRSTQHTLRSPRQDVGSPIHLDSHQFTYSQAHGRLSSSEVDLLVLSQDNFHTQGLLAPSSVPTSSSSWRLGGNYSRQLSDNHEFRTGLSYEQRVEELGRRGDRVLPANEPRQQIDAFGLGTLRVGSGILVEYGLYSTMRDGSVAMSPHGGLVMDIGRNWRADAMFRSRITDLEDSNPNFSLAYYGGGEIQRSSEQHLYKLGFERKISDVESFRIGARHREIANTLRLFFNDDFFDQVESLYLVKGDRLPEFQMALSRKLGQKILAKFETNYAEGGGGVFTAKDNALFRNRVRYLVTSLDTQFQKTSTGLFLAFHRIEQSLDPLAGHELGREAGLDRLQVKVTQELGFLVDLGTEWAVLLNVELTRGATPFSKTIDPDELRSQIAGGIAVKF